MSKEKKEEFPSNSKSKRVAPIRPDINEDAEAEIMLKKPKIQPRAQGMRRRKSITRSIAQTFFGEDAKSVVNYIIMDVLVPAAKNMIQEAVSSGIERFLFGEEGASRRHRSKDRDRTIISYNTLYGRDRSRDEGNPYDPKSRYVRGGGRFDMSEVIFKKGDEATEVLEGMCDILEEYRQVTVADFYELADLDAGTWVDQKWGWTNLAKAYVTYTRGGYVIVGPKSVELD